MGFFAQVGSKNTRGFFLRRDKIVGSAVFFGGFLLILIGWFLFTTIGFCLQIYGLFLLFRDFVRVIFSYAQTLPVIGPIIRNSPFAQKIVDTIAGSKESFGGNK